MTTLGITGHQHLPTQVAWEWVATEFRTVIRRLSEPITGVSSLAVGADQLFAQVILECGGVLEVVVPFPEYERRFEEPDRVKYWALCRAAKHVEVLPWRLSEELSYLQAGKRVVDVSEAVVAVWDGEAAKGVGGTGDIVLYAAQCGKPIIHINPRDQTTRFD